MSKSCWKSTLILRKNPLQSPGPISRATDILSLTTHFEHPNYLDNIVSKWKMSDRIKDSMPPNVAYSLAFSFEHPCKSPSVERRLLLLNYLKAHRARAPGANSAIHTLSIAYGSYVDKKENKEFILDTTFGTNATRHGGTNARRTEHVWRAEFAYAKKWYPDGPPASSTGRRQNTQCAEMISLPLILQSIEDLPSKTPIVIASYTVDASNQLPMKMCRNCAAYANRATQGRLGLSIVDAAAEPPVIYESKETVRYHLFETVPQNRALTSRS